MLIAGQETHLFNPYITQRATNDELSNEINKLANSWKNGANMPSEYAHNIDVCADILIIYAEFISRLTEETKLIDLKADTLEAKQVYQLRTDWLKAGGEKMSIDYFKSQAKECVKDLRQEQYQKESMLTRFKKAYESIESKMNAQKKLLEAMRYEEL